MTELPVRIRPMKPEDANLVYNSWIRSNVIEFRSVLRDGERRFAGDHVRIVDDIIARSQVLVACDPDDEDEIYGWLCFERAPEESIIGHYAFTKQVFRGMGVARRLWLAANPDLRPAPVSHTGIRFHMFRERYGLTYDPLQLFFRKAPRGENES